MFSYIFCKTPLPLNEELKSLDVKWDEIEFQTKDLENCLEKYIITEDGKLMEEITEYEYTYYTEEEKKSKNHNPWNFIKDQKIIKLYNKNVDFHGKITFYEILKYSETEDIWVDFDAYFVYGKLDKIQLIKTEKVESSTIRSNKFFQEQIKIKNSFCYKFKKYSGWYWFFGNLARYCCKLSNVFSKIQSFIYRYLLK